MPSKRIRSVFTNTSGGGGGTPTTDVPTARWAEDANSADALGALLVAEPENVSVADAFAYLIVKEGEDTNSDDAWSQFIAGAYGEDSSSNDLAKVTLLDVDVARTGTPDSDLMFDAYTNQLAAFAATNFGNTSLQCRGVTTVSPGSDEQRAYIAIDLRGFLGFVGVNAFTGGTQAFLVTVQAANSNLLAGTALTCNFRYSAAKPFTESTVTWNSPPSLGSSVISPTATVAAGGGFAAYTFGLTAGQLSPCLGNWLLLTFTGPSAATTVLVDTFTIKSRDDATASNRPKFSLAAQIGT